MLASSRRRGRRSPASPDLRFVPAPVHRAALRIAHRLRVVWWSWRRPLTHGVSIIARDDESRVLLIRQSYGSGAWLLPGGALRTGEDPAAAAAREFREELGCPVEGLALVAVRDENLHGAINRVHLFAGRLTGTPRPDEREVIAAHLFALDALPADCGRKVHERLALLER